MASETVLVTETDTGENRIADAITSRLNEAIPKGSAADVARRARIPYPSLREYLSGAQPRPAALVALARAAGVRIEWLMTGDGPMRADSAAPPGMAEAPAGYRPTASPADAIDVANLAWALEFVEKTTLDANAEQRVSLMLSAAGEFRRVQRMPPLPAFQAAVLVIALDAAEQLLRAAGQPLDAVRRVGLMLSIYDLVTGGQVAR